MNKSFLWDLFSQPTAPFRESLVRACALRELTTHRVPHFIDPIGNIVVGVSSARDYAKLLRLKSKEPVRLFMAHMDHPGFHGMRWTAPDRLEIKWYGGSPTRHLDGAPVWIANAQGFAPQAGRLLDVTLTTSARPSIDRAAVSFSGNDAQSVLGEAPALFGGFRFRAPVWEADGRIYTKAADDLGGVFSIISTAVGLWTGKGKARERAGFLGLLTRAEEVGFIGAIGHFNLGWLNRARRPVLVVSLETSRTLPGAEFGKGPVVRLGDRATVFDPGALKVLTDVAAAVLPERHQRRIMDGGTCEATAALAFELPSIGISIPLGNYHNEGFEGGPDCAGERGPAPEFVDESDLGGMIALCHALLKPGLPWNEPWKTRKAGFQKSLKESRALLKE